MTGKSNQFSTISSLKSEASANEGIRESLWRQWPHNESIRSAAVFELYKKLDTLDI